MCLSNSWTYLDNKCRSYFVVFLACDMKNKFSISVQNLLFYPYFFVVFHESELTFF